MSTDGTPVDIKPRSRDVTDGMQKAPSRAMLRAVGMGDDDWVKPQVAIASSWNEVTPCNMTLRKLAEHAKDGVRAAGGFPLEFGTITVSDGISMGHEGMRASLVSREVITDSVECVMHAERLDGFVGLAGCDKSIPAMLMAAARLDLPSVFVYNGSTMPGELDGKALDITSVFEAVGACALGAITEAELTAIERNACPGEGACGGMFTANTMSSIAEAIGMSLPGTASPPAIDGRRESDARMAGEAVVNMLRLGITPRRIMTKQAFENAIAVTLALAGSLAVVVGQRRDREGLAFAGGCAFIAGLLGAAAASVFPVMLHSTLGAAYSIDAYAGAVGGPGLALAAVWWPVAMILSLVYTAFVLRQFKGKVRVSAGPSA